MPAFPIAASAAQALSRHGLSARTYTEAVLRAGQVVEFVSMAHPARFETPEEVDAEFKDAFEAGFARRISLDDGWAASLSFWRPPPTFPVATSARNALNQPKGYASTEGDASRIALGVVVLAREVVGKSYRRRKAAVKAAGDLHAAGIVDVEPFEGEWRLAIRFWKFDVPVPAPKNPEPVSDDQRRVMQDALNAPLVARRPQLPPEGLFSWAPSPTLGVNERIVPGEAAILLDDEGDGIRYRGPAKDLAA